MARGRFFRVAFPAGVLEKHMPAPMLVYMRLAHSPDKSAATTSASQQQHPSSNITTAAAATTAAATSTDQL